MPRIKDKGIIISSRKFGESSLLVKILSQEHGLYFALVKNALKRKNNSIYHQGNLVDFNWNAKNENDLGLFKVDIVKSYLNHIISSKVKIEAFNKIFIIIDRFIPDRDRNIELFIELLEIISKSNLEDQQFLFFYIKFCFFLMRNIGYGVDFSRCFISGVGEVAFVSPKTGNPVCFEVGKNYKHKLYEIPKFLIKKSKAFSEKDIINGLKLLDFFLLKYDIIK